MNDLRVHPRHMRAAKVCARGSREWCAHNRVSWNRFVSEGLPVAEMRAINDPIVNRVIAEAEKEAANGR